MNQIIRWLLISSIIIVVIVAIIAFSIIMTKVYKLKKQIKNDKIQLTKELMNKEGEKKLIERKDFGQPIYELENNIKNHIDHEIVEFCINSIIRNEFNNILMIGNVGIYESIGISNKTSANITVLKNQFDFNSYKSMDNLIDHNLNIVNSLKENKYKNYFDAILLLDEYSNFDQFFEKYEKYLKNKGMFIISNTKLNKKNSKLLERKIKNFNYKYDMLKWHKGFALIVKIINA